MQMLDREKTEIDRIEAKIEALYDNKNERKSRR